MTRAQLQSAQAPFDVVEARTGDRSTIVGFRVRDARGNFAPAACFAEGGCVPLDDLLRYFDVLPSSQQARNAPKIARGGDPVESSARM